MVKTKQYENGLKVIVKEMPSLYSLSVGFCVGVGSTLEDTSNNGFAHFIEHMMFKGTPKRSAFEISDCVKPSSSNVFNIVLLLIYLLSTTSSQRNTAPFLRAVSAPLKVQKQ